jgi:hypothetical protein
VQLRFHRWAVGLQKDGRDITHVIFESKAGREAIACRTVIDATGDADLCLLAGEELDRDTVHPWLWFRTANVDTARAESAKGAKPYMRTVNTGGFLHPWGSAERISRQIDAANPDDLSFAEVECRRLVREEMDRLRAEAPGFEDAYIAGFATTLGITDSRRLQGRHVLTREEMDCAVDDVIAVTGNWTKYGSIYNIPYRSLLPAGVDNLLVAGRCISVDRRAHHSTKEIPPCFATGEAAGTAAALALQQGVRPATLEYASLRSALLAQGAYLG